MRIGIDSRPLREERTSGIPAYVRNLLSELAKIDDRNEYVLYAHKDFDFPLPNKRWTKKSGALTRFGTIWMQAELPYWVKRDKVDLFWGTQHTIPIGMPAQTKVVLTVHDLVHLVFPETMRPLNYFINKYLIPPSVKRSDAIISESEWTLNDVKKFLNPNGKIMRVIPLGIGEQFKTRPKKVASDYIRSNYKISEPYILTVGTFEPRKNLLGAFRAFSLIADRVPHHIVVVGQTGWKNEKVRDEVAKSSIRDRIHFLGYVPDDHLPLVYSGAELLLFPSIYEGFGFPPLEAMSCGVPVVASNVSSIPEVVGEAATLVNPHSADDIARGVLECLQNEDLRVKMIQRGFDQIKKFSWEKAAKGMLALFSELEGKN